MDDWEILKKRRELSGLNPLNGEPLTKTNTSPIKTNAPPIPRKQEAGFSSGFWDDLLNMITPSKGRHIEDDKAAQFRKGFNDKKPMAFWD